MVDTNKQETGQSKQIEREKWPDFFDTVTLCNRGQQASIETVESGSSHKSRVNEALFFSIVYDPPDGNDDIVIGTGQEQIDYAHTIKAPTEIQAVQDEKGILTGLEIKDKGGTQTSLHFVKP